MSKVQRFRVKVKPFEAMQFTGANEREICDWLGTSQVMLGPESFGATLKVYFKDYGDWLTIHPSRWIVKKADDNLDVYTDVDFKDEFEEIDSRMGFPVPPATIDHSLDALERGNNG